MKMKKSEEPIRYEFTNNAIKKNMEKKYQHIIKQMKEITHEKEHPKKIIKYLTNVPLDEHKLMHPIYISTTNLKPTIPYQGSQLEDKPINFKEAIHDLQQIDFVGVVSPKEFVEEPNLEYNYQQLKMLKGGLNVIEKKKKMIKKKEGLMHKPNLLEEIQPGLADFSPASKSKKKPISKTKAIEERLKFGKTLSEFLQSDLNLIKRVDHIKPQIIRHSSTPNISEGLEPEQPVKISDSQVDQETFKPSPLIKPTFLSPNQLRFPFSQPPSREGSVEEKIQTFDIKNIPNQKKRNKTTSQDAYVRIEQKVHEMVMDSKYGRHIRSPIGILKKDRTKENVASLVSMRTKSNVANVITPGKMNLVKSPTSIKGALKKAQELINNSGNLNSELSRKYKNITQSCNNYIRSSHQTYMKITNNMCKIKDDLNKANSMINGNDYSIENDIQQQISKDIDDAASYFLNFFKHKRKTKTSVA
jgi:hypothetical protein